MADEIKTVILVIKSTTEGIDRAKAQLTELGATYTETERRVTQQTSSLEKLASRYNDVYRITQQYTVQQAQLQRAAETYTQKTGDSARAQELLAIGLTGLAQKHETAMTRAVQHAAALDTQAAAARATALADAEAAKASDAQSIRLEILRQKYDPLYAAQSRYLGRLREIGEAEKAGALSPVTATAARIETKSSFAGQVRDITGASAADRESAAAATAAEKQAAALEVLRQKYVPLAGAQAIYLRQLGEISTLERAGAVSAEALSVAREQAKAAFAGQVQEITGVAEAQRQAALADLEAARAAETQAIRLEALRQRYDPLYAAQQRYLAQIREIAEAEKAGALPAPVADAARAETKSSFAGQVRDITGASAADRESAASAAAEKQAASIDLLRQKYIPLAAAQATYLKQLSDLKTLEQAAGGQTAELAAARDKVKTAFAGEVQEITGVAQAQRAAATQESEYAAAAQAVKDKLDPRAAATRKVAEETARLNVLVQAGKLNDEEAAAAAALYAKEVEGLAAAHGHATGMAGRFREALVLVHEFLRGDWKRAIGSAMIELQNFNLMGLLLNPFSLGLIAITAAVVGVFAAMQQFAQSQKELANAMRLGGDATGYTKDQMNALADAAARTTDVSTKEARWIEAAFASTGRIGGQVLAQLTSMTGDFASATGKKANEAGGELAKMFSDPAKGAKELDDAYNRLDGNQLRQIKDLADSNHLQEAQQKLIEALAPAIDKSSDKVTKAGGFWKDLGKIVDRVVESIGRMGTSPGLDDQIAKLETLKKGAQSSGFTLAGNLAGTEQSLPIFATAGDIQKRIDEIKALQKAQQDQASADETAAINKLEAKNADELVRKYDPLITRKRDLTVAQEALNKTINDGAGNVEDYKKALGGIDSALANLKTPVQEAQEKLDIDRKVAGASPAARPALRARLTEENKAAQSPNPDESTNAKLLGNIAGQSAATGQISAANDAANAEVRRAQAEDRLATAAGKSTDAVRQATIANQVAEFAFTHGGVAVDKYRNALEQATAAEQKREIAATVLQLNQQADASDRLAAAEQKGSSAAHQAALENQAFADALKIAAQGTDAFTKAYDQYLSALERADKSSGESGIQKELRARQDSLAIAQLELSLTQRNVETRGEEVAALREKLKLQEQFPTATADELNNLVQIAGQEGKINAQIKANDEAEKDFRAVAKGVFTDITGAITDWANGTKTFKSALTDLSNQLLKLAQDQFIINPLKQMFDKQLGQGGTLGPGGLLGSLFGGGDDHGRSSSPVYSDPIGPTMGTGDPMASNLLPQSSGISGWFKGLFSGSSSGNGNAGQQDYTATIGPSMGTGDPMPSELLPHSGGGIGGWLSSLFGGSGGGAGAGGAANDNSLVKAGSDLTTAAAKLGTDTASKLSGAATSLGDLKNLMNTTSTMNVQAATVNLTGATPGGTPGLGGIGSLFGGSSPSTPSGVDGVTASTYSSGLSDSTVALDQGFALGGAFSHGNVIPFANGGAFQGSGVYSSPSYFPMAGGRTGMLGEAGPEAVMPLVRGPSGSLGVKAHGGGGSPAPQVIDASNTIHNEQHFHGDMSQEGMNRARRTSSQMSRDTLEHAQRKALRFGS